MTQPPRAPKPTGINGSGAEWMVIRLDPAFEGGFELHTQSDGSQYWRLRQAAEIAKGAGDDWRLLHHHTMIGPAEHQRWVERRGQVWAP